MSQNTGCQGSITIPKAQFSKTCKAIIEEYNTLLEKDVNKFNQFIEAFLDENKGKRNVNWFNSMQDAYEKKFPDNGYNPKNHFVILEPFSKIHSLTKKWDDKTRTYENTKPAKIKFKKVKLSGPEVFIELPFANEASFTLDKEKVAIDVYVGYNNHNLERAQSNPFFRSTLEKIKNVEFTRTTGGTIYAKQERDNSYEDYADQSTYPMLSLGCDSKLNKTSTKKLK